MEPNQEHNEQDNQQQTLSTGADVSHAMRDLNKANLSARTSLIEKKVFDRVDANGDIVIVNDLGKTHQRRPREKMSPTVKKLLLAIVGTMTVAIAGIMIFMAVTKKEPEVAEAPVDEVRIAFNNFANHILGNTDSTDDFDFASKEEEFYASSRIGSKLDPLPEADKLQEKYKKFKQLYVAQKDDHIKDIEILGWFYVHYGTGKFLNYETILEKFASTDKDITLAFIEKDMNDQIAEYPQAEEYIKKRYNLNLQALGMAELMDKYGCIQDNTVDVFCTYDPTPEDLDTINRYNSNNIQFFGELSSVRRRAQERFIEIYNDIYNSSNEYDEEAADKADQDEDSQPTEDIEWDEDVLDKEPSEEAEKPAEAPKEEKDEEAKNE